MFYRYSYADVDDMQKMLASVPPQMFPDPFCTFKFLRGCTRWHIEVTLHFGVALET
jgi:hypothetical protein